MDAKVDYVFIGDDFTGSSDTLATLARTGRRARLFLDPPDPKTIAAERLDAVGFATELRALPPEAIAEHFSALAPTLKTMSPRILHYKVCSTFDSSPEVGSIGAAVTALERHLAPELVAILGGQPSLGRYCAFGNLFARGPDGQVYRIDRHPVMRNHPITPMTEADLGVHLARQGLHGLRLMTSSAVDEGAAPLKVRIERLMRAGVRHILFDVSNQGHLDAIGSALACCGSRAHPLLVIGASSVAEAFATGSKARVPDTPARGNAENGPCLVVAGSRSEVTAVQVEAARRFNRMPISRQDLADKVAIGQLGGRCAGALEIGENVLVHLIPSEKYGGDGTELSHKLAELVAAILARQPVCALGVAGGDTSSIVVRRLGFHSLAFEEQLDTGVAICVAGSNVTVRDGMRLMLKGGQVGSDAVFDRFVSAMDTRAPTTSRDLWRHHS